MLHYQLLLRVRDEAFQSKMIRVPNQRGSRIRSQRYVSNVILFVGQQHSVGSQDVPLIAKELDLIQIRGQVVGGLQCIQTRRVAEKVNTRKGHPHTKIEGM